MAVGIIVPVSPIVFMIIFFICVVGVCCASISVYDSEKSSTNVYKGNNANVVKCRCGFKYNRKNHDYCPNCGRKSSILNFLRK